MHSGFVPPSCRRLASRRDLDSCRGLNPGGPKFLPYLADIMPLLVPLRSAHALAAVVDLREPHAPPTQPPRWFQHDRITTSPRSPIPSQTWLPIACPPATP